jgi:hypothetical protein
MKRRLKDVSRRQALGLMMLGAAWTGRAEVVALSESEIVGIDRVAMTLSLKFATPRKEQTVLFTSQTRLFINRKYATTRELALGDRVIGTAQRTAEAKLEAVRLYVEKRKDAQRPAPSRAVDASSPRT